MNRYLLLLTLIAVFSLLSTGTAADEPQGQYYPLEGLYIYPRPTRTSKISGMTTLQS